MISLQTCYKTLFLLLFALLFSSVAEAAPAQALGYTPKYAENFSHFTYLNPDAPKGGDLTLAAIGNYDSLNPYILKGIAADGLSQLLFETLMISSMDEPFSQYGLLAEDAQLADDKLSVTFRLRTNATFHDGTAVTADDVAFSFNTLRSEKAHPQYRFYWGDITSVTVVDEQTVRFNFAKVNPELHMIAGQIPIFSRNWVGNTDFSTLAETKPIASGPYIIDNYAIGKQITYRRNPDYWGKDLAVRKGSYNFDTITYKYYRDATVALEAFKAGEYEFNHEYNSKKWATDYSGPKFSSKEILLTQLPHKNNAGMQGFVFNLRKPLFQDQRVRKAISLALDFEWSNRNLFYDQYERCYSYFSNSELAASGTPSEAELQLLKPWQSKLPEELFSQSWQPPSTAAPNSLRTNLRTAQKLLQRAGWSIQDGVLTNRDKQPFHFEVILAQKGFERILAPFAKNLQKLGIEVSYRTVDVALYQQRMDSFDFDMVVASFGQSQSPGNELMGMFHSSSAEQNGSRNLMGLQNPVVDDLVEKIIYAENREALVTASHALDRVLLHGDYLVPHWYIGSHRIAWWDRFAYPETLPLYYSAEEWMVMSWWHK